MISSLCDKNSKITHICNRLLNDVTVLEKCDDLINLQILYNNSTNKYAQNWK